MHLAYYHVVANWGTGLEPDDPTIVLNRLYMETLPAVAAALEPRSSTRRASRPRAGVASSCALAAGVRAER